MVGAVVTAGHLNAARRGRTGRLSKAAETVRHTIEPLPDYPGERAEAGDGGLLSETILTGRGLTQEADLVWRRWTVPPIGQSFGRRDSPNRPKAVSGGRDEAANLTS